MSSIEPRAGERRRNLKALARIRARHTKLLKKVMKARARYDERSRKLQSLEAEMAELVRRTYHPESERLGQAAAGDPHLRHARLIFNPDAGSIEGATTKRLGKIIERLRAHGIRAEIGLKTSGKAVRELVKEVTANGEDFIIVAGGDGTIEQVASQLVGSAVTLGIIPVGTMNNLARALGIPLDLNGACELLAMTAARQIDIGRVAANGKPQIEYFMESAGMGLMAIGLPAGQAAEKGNWGVLPAALRRLFDSRPYPIEVTLDGGEVIKANSELVTVSNSPLLGKNIMIAPDAKMDDGLLDIAVYDRLSKAELLGHLISSASGSRTYHPKIKYYRSRHVTIRSELPFEAHSDKDVIEPKQVLEMELIPKALSMIVGQGFALTMPVEFTPQPAPPAAKPAAGDSAASQPSDGTRPPASAA